MARRKTREEPQTASTRTCPTCLAKPGSPCHRPNGKPCMTHRTRQQVPVPLSHLAVTKSGVGHVRSGAVGSRGLCRTSVTLENVPNTVRVECSSCYSMKAHMLAHPVRTWPNGLKMLPLDGGIPDDAEI